MSCSYEVAYNQSKVLADVAKDPMNSMNDKISSSIERAKGFAKIVENALNAVLKKVEVLSNGLGDLGQGKCRLLYTVTMLTLVQMSPLVPRHTISELLSSSN